MSNRILITGAGSGIGKDSAFELAGRGHDVIASTHTEEEAKNLIAEAEDWDLDLTVEKLDILNADDRARAAGWGVDVLVNNAGIGESGPLAEIPVELVRRNFETDVFAMLELTQVLVKRMLEQCCGRILIVGSLAGRVYVPYLGAYCMTKFALEAAAHAFRYELEPHNIKVSIIEPGPYATGFNEKMEESKYRWFDDHSMFASETELIKKEEHKLLSDQYSTETIVMAIVKAIEAAEPKFRYVAPLEYKVMAQMAVGLGR